MMKPFFLMMGAASLSAASLAAMPASVQAQTATPSPTSTSPIPKIPVEKYTLPNGLQVILHRDATTPIISVNTWYHVGSGDEEVHRTGFAHLFEHIMFMGSENVPTGQFDQLLEAAGATNNGSTTEDRTNYYETLPSNALSLALWLDSDRMGFLLPALDQEKLDLQRDVVKNERRQRVDNVPYGRADEIILEALYPKGHPYSWPVIGSMEDLSAATLDDVKAFFTRYYAPNNATITIAGDFNPDTVKALVEKYFGGIPRGPELPQRPNPAPVVLDTAKYLVHEDQVQLPRLYYTWPTVKAYAADDAPLGVLGSILAEGKNSRLYKTLVYDTQVAQDINAYQYGSKLAGVFQVIVTPKPGQSLATIDALVRAELAAVMEYGIDERELDRVLNSTQASYLAQLESVEHKADLLNRYNYYVGTPDFVQQDFARYAAVSLADVQRVAKAYLAKPAVILSVVPEGQPGMALRASTTTAQPETEGQ